MEKELWFLIIGGLISLFSSLITLIANHHFLLKHDERKREWELENREFNRYLEVKKTIIEEAHEYLNSYIDAVRTLANFEIAIIQTDNVNKFQATIDKVSDLVDLTIKYRNSFISLGDLELLALNNQLVSIFGKEHFDSFELITKITNNEYIDKNTLIKKVEEFNMTAISVIDKMRIKLNDLPVTASKQG